MATCHKPQDAPQQQEATPPDPEQGSNKPWYSKRYRAPAGGFIDLAIYMTEKKSENNGVTGNTYVVFQTSVKKSFKGKDGWVNLHSFRPEELLIVAEAMREAFSVICNEQNRA